MKMLLAFVAAVLMLAGCDRAPSGEGVRLALNWKPEPQFGGFFQAQISGEYAKNGLNVEIIPGGAGTPTVQMIGAGTAEFGIVSADEIVIARDRGNDVVGLFAVYQDCPQGLMTRSERGFARIEDIFTHPGTVAMQKALPYARWLSRTVNFDNVTVVPSPGGDLTQFLSDPNFTQQCFLTSEPLAAGRRGIDTKTFLVKESGYNPYTTVLATSGAYLRKHPEKVAAMTAAVAAGWRQYLDDPAAANAAMQQQRADMDAQTFAESADAQKPLILGGDAAGLGHMSEARWSALIAQLKTLGDISGDIEPQACFVPVTIDALPLRP